MTPWGLFTPALRALANERRQLVTALVLILVSILGIFAGQASAAMSSSYAYDRSEASAGSVRAIVSTRGAEIARFGELSGAPRCGYDDPREPRSHDRAPRRRTCCPTSTRMRRRCGR